MLWSGTGGVRPTLDTLARDQISSPLFGDRPSFEVATIKPWQRTPPPPPSDSTAAPAKVMKIAPVGPAPLPTKQVHMIWPISILITSAYNLPGDSGHRIIGGPDWRRQDIDQYEIQAKIGDSEYAADKNGPAQQRRRFALMEQSLLADRFNLKVHFETREMPAYALVVAKRGPKLIAAKSDEATRISLVGNVRGGEMTAVATTIEQFVLSPFLTGLAGGPVVNQTGLKGSYDFTLKWDSEIGADAPSFFTAIQEQLGLQLIASEEAAGQK